MVKNKLDKQIRVVVVSFLFGILIYLLAAFFLLSKYPLNCYEFNLEKAYEVIKDSLTIAASFLAPVAAFILFNDWSESHVLINNEKEVKGILEESEKLTAEVQGLEQLITGFYQSGLSVDEIKKYRNEAYKLLDETSIFMQKLDSSKRNFERTDFHSMCSNFHTLQFRLLTKIIQLLETYSDLENCKSDPNQHSLLPGLIAQEVRAQTDYYDLVSIFTLDFDLQMDELNNLADKHRIK